MRHLTDSHVELLALPRAGGKNVLTEHARPNRDGDVELEGGSSFG